MQLWLQRPHQSYQTSQPDGGSDDSDGQPLPLRSPGRGGNGKANTPRTGALNTNTIDLTIRCEPSKKFFEAGLVSGERLDPEYPPIGIDRCSHMLICVGIHTTNNHPYH
jgi:hypothetical protein